MYNLGLLNDDRVSNFARRSVFYTSHHKNIENSHNDDMFLCKERCVLILYVGGTIGMTKTLNGTLRPCKGYLTHIVQNMEELKNRPDIAHFDIVEYDELLDSSEMEGKDYVHIAMDIERYYDDYDGFLILHGTDTLHYTASALSFLLTNLNKPVILTGSIVPLLDPYNDARHNFIMSLMLAFNPVICEVCIFFNNFLMRGNCCIKLYHTFGAFCSLNYPVLGILKTTGFYLRKDLLISQQGGPLKVNSDMSGRVVVCVLHTDCNLHWIKQLLEEIHMETIQEGGTNHNSNNNNNEGEEKEKKTYTKHIENISNKDDGTNIVKGDKQLICSVSNISRQYQTVMDAILFEIGGIRTLDNKISILLQDIVRQAKKQNILTCVTTREPFGGLSLDEQRQLYRISPDLIYLHMTSAAAETKLMYLLGKGLSLDTVKEILPCDLRGEVIPSAVFKAKL